MSRAPTVSELTALKDGNIAQRLIRCGRLVHEAGLDRSREIYPDLRPAHLALMPHIDHAGTRITTIAERARITKQAVSQSVADLLEQGLVETVPDPNDGRAKLVRFTARGRRAIAEGLGVLMTIDEEIREALGSRRACALLQTLRELDALLTAAD